LPNGVTDSLPGRGFGEQELGADVVYRTGTLNGVTAYNEDVVNELLTVDRYTE
jgi:hypothetical protein